MGMTLAQKILARCSARREVSVGEVVTAEPDVFELIDLVLPSFIATLKRHGIEGFRYPERCVVYFDHEAPAHTGRVAALKRQLRAQLQEMGIRHVYPEGRHGISHQAIVEHGHVLPGMLAHSMMTAWASWRSWASVTTSTRSSHTRGVARPPNSTGGAAWSASSARSR